MPRSRQQQTKMVSIASPKVAYLWIVILSLSLGKVLGQDGLCACSPSSYTFQLDFSLTCPPVDVTRNDGISATFCQISPFGDADVNITDLVPVEVEYIDVLELGQGFDVLSQDNITGTFVDGDTFEYTSLVAQSGSTEIPKVIQLNIFAYNAAGEPIINFYAIAYSNLCDAYPTLIEGESAGWTRFKTLEPPSPEFCPAVPVIPPETPSPTEAPDETDSPSLTPSSTPPTEGPEITDEPTASPTEGPEPTDPPTVTPATPVPTEGPEPTDPPTVTPATPAPTEGPVPTDPPTVTPATPAPTDGPEATDPPTEMSMSMSMAMEAFENGVKEWVDIQYGMGDMSMSMPQYEGSYLRKVDKAAKSEKAKAAKSGKAKAAKSEKAEAAKSEKAKAEKSGKSTKLKSEKTKSPKDEKVRRRRRLRVHRVD